MITYTWKIHSLVKQNIEDREEVVITVVWEKFGVADDGHYGSFKAVLNLDADSISFEDFVPYPELKESVIVSWILANTQETYINAKIAESIESSRSHRVQVEDGNFPWS